MSTIWIETRNGEKTVTRVDYDTGKRTVLSKPPSVKPKRGLSNPDNGVIGGPATLAKAKKLDADLGVADCVKYREVHSGAYEAVYDSVSNYDKWMHAHKRVNFNAGHGTPCPGDFRGQYPTEDD